MPHLPAPFTRREAEEGAAVTLEHVPPRSFKAGGLAMCLTCTDCNNSASRVEGAAVDAAQDDVKVRLDAPGLPTHNARLSQGSDGLFLQVAARRDVDPNVFVSAMRQGAVTVKGFAPTTHYVNVPWLKAAYLAVFSLLGAHGYKYAEGAAIEAVRKQIMSPGEVIIPRFAAEASAWKQRDGIIASRKPPGWIVKLGDRVVLLPRGWDREFYKRIDSTSADEIAIDGNGTLWFPAKFAANRRVTVLSFRSEPFEMFGEDLFGATGQITRDGETIPFIAADVSGQEVTIMVTTGLEVSGPLV